MTWHRVSRDNETRRPILTRTAKTPGRGVWVAEERRDDDLTIEHIAVNGEHRETLRCRCGQHRDNALRLAVSFL